MSSLKLFADKYVLTKRCIGHGAEARVYLAHETTTKRQLVCKLVNLDKIRGLDVDEIRRRKLQEADILRQLQHVRIVFCLITTKPVNSA
ncbi:hypothetical protein HJFPF1_03601 [Paramyrothecium foliicola]|nr:hypothetical protein HJFPF1_03601 [Paramyrothecium foliicola]